MFEFLMAEWHLPPEHIIDNWTNEMLDLMVGKLVERKTREARSEQGASGSPVSEARKVADSELFSLLGNKIKVVKRDAN